jgi:ABC-type transport system substrate-binding protein
MIGVLAVVSLLLAACEASTPEPEVVEVTRVVAGTPEVVEVTVVSEPPEEEGDGPIPADGLTPCLPLPEIALGNRGPGVASGRDMSQPVVQAAAAPAEAPVASPPQQQGDVYRVGVFADLTTLNYWAANGPDNTVWNSYMLPPRLTMYDLSDQRFDFVPLVALDLPEPLIEEGDYWVVEIPIRDDIVWSDGEPFTAEDVAWTANAVIKLGLISGNWSSWYDANYLERVEAVEPYVVKYTYHTKPGLAVHQEGALQAPILAEHYWAPIVDEATASLDAMGDDASEEDLLAAQQEAHDILFAHEPEGEPLAGAFFFSQWEQSAFLEIAANEDYLETGAVVTMYENGAYHETLADVHDFTLYGDPEGDVALEYEVGPNVSSVVYSIYGSQDAAVLALKNGEIDFLLNSLGLQRGLLSQVQDDPNLTVVQNPANSFRYLAFNHRRQPMNDCSFRQAVAFLIDKEFVTQRILQGVASPVYSFVPQSNPAWYFDDVPKFGLYDDGTNMSREDRLNMAVAILEQAGYSWEDDQKPVWNVDGGHVEPAGRLLMPDGTPVPTLDLWGPTAGYDPMRATFATWVENWLNEVGIPVEAQLAGFNVLIPRIFTEQDFDMYILGWSLDTFPGYMRDFWHSEQAVPDGNNAAGYVNPEFDELSDELMTCETQEACKEISDQLQAILATEVPYVLLFYSPIIEPYRSAAVDYPYDAHLSGLQYSHQGPLQSLQTTVSVIE